MGWKRVFFAAISSLFYSNAFLQDTVGVCPAGAIGSVGSDIIVRDSAFVGDKPFCRSRGVIDGDNVAQIAGRVESFNHKLLDIRFINPCSTKTYFYFGCI